MSRPAQVITGQDVFRLGVAYGRYAGFILASLIDKSILTHAQDTVARTFLSPTKDKLGVEWPSGKISEFAAVWLRDNCPDPKIIDPSSFGRLLLMSDLDTEITIEKVGTKDTMKY